MTPNMKSAGFVATLPAQYLNVEMTPSFNNASMTLRYIRGAFKNVLADFAPIPLRKKSAKKRLF